MLQKKRYTFILLIFIIISMQIFPKKSEENKKKSLKRAIGEVASLLAISQTNYWLKYSNWIEDWQFELNWTDQKKRIFGLKGQRFDSNPFQTNWTHGLSGALYYNFARTNGLDIYESTAFTTVVSLYWELVVEWREVISINDNFFTSIGGISIGESFFQLGSYFNGKPGITNTIAGILTNPVMAINRWLDRKHRYSYPSPDKCNMSLFFGNFFLMNDIGKPSKDRDPFFGFDSSLTYLPKIKETGAINRTIKGAIRNDINIRLEIKDGGIDEISVNTKNVYYGNFKQNIKEFEANYIKGHSFLLSLASGFDFFKKKSIWANDSATFYKYIDDSVLVETPTKFRDKLAVINITGPYTELKYYFGKGKISFINSLSLDFGLINAFALNKYSETEDISYTKATLYNYGYYYGFGYTFHSRLGLKYKWFNAGIALKHQKYNSVEGLDRFEDKIRNDFNIKDIKSELTFKFGYTFKILPLAVILIMEDRYRKGIMKSISNLHKETKVYIRLDLFL